jgi:hypothetical protein
VSEDLAETWLCMSESTPDKRLAQIYLKSAKQLAPERIQNIQIERVREKLPKQVRDRDYAGAVTSLSSLLETLGWESTFSILQEVCNASGHLRERGGDVLFHFLGLDFLMGLDIDPLIEFLGLKGSDLESLKNEAQERAFLALKKQVALGNTYYLDAERLRDLPFLLVLPDILNIREQELLFLSDTPSHNEVLGTYYGFTILTSAWSLETGMKAFIEMCASRGKRIEIRSKRLTIRDYIWSDLNPRMRTLIKQTARLCLSQAGTVLTDAIECLGDTGDSRILHVLQEASRHIFEWDAKSELKKALGKVGGPKAEEMVETTQRVNHRQFQNTYFPEQEIDEYHERYNDWDRYDERYDDDEW